MGIEFALRGWLDERQVARLRRDIGARATPECDHVIITGHELRYRDVAGLAAFAALLDDMQEQFPHTAFLLNHFSPELSAAASLAGLDGAWRYAADQTMPLASPPDAPSALNAERRQQALRPTGIRALDAALGGGVDLNSTWLIEGLPGAGKTALGAQFLAEGIARGEAGLYITASETPARLMSYIARQWPHLEKAVTQRKLVILDPAPFFTEIRLAKQRKGKGAGGAWDEVWRFTQDVVKQGRNQGAQRIVIDPISPLLLGSDSAIDLWDSAQTLVTSLEENLGATTLLTHLALPDPAFTTIGMALQSLCAGVVQTRQGEGGAARLALRIAKHRHCAAPANEIICELGAGAHVNATLPRAA